MIKIVIFDLDGVLVDAKEIHYISLNEAIAEVGTYFTITRHEHLTKYDGLPTNKKLELLTEDKGLPKEFYNQIWNRKQELTKEIIVQNLSEDAVKIDLVNKLKESGYKVYVASNSIRETLELMLKQIGILHLVDLVLSNEDVKSPKPHPEVYLKAMVESGVKPSECLIVEDSIHGRQAATESGGVLFPVDKVEEVNAENVLNFINSLEQKKPMKYQGKNFNVLVPMAGAGSRFSQAGYIFPKPLIEVNGKPMIQLVVENLGIDANFIFIVQKEHYEKYHLQYLLNLIAPNCKIVQVDGVTEGAACTTLLAKEFINSESPLIIANSDQVVDWEPSKFYYSMVSDNIDGGILTFKGSHPKWSYSRLGDDGYIAEVAEKRPISDNATCFHYNTPVLMSDGSKELIGKLVNSQSAAEVISFNVITNSFEAKKITGWVRKDEKNVDWYSLTFESQRNANNGKLRSSFVTGDHEIYTKRGKIKVENLNEDDEVLTSFLSPNDKQMEFIDGTLLGDGMYRKPNKKGELGRLVVKQSKKQEDWLFHKKHILSVFGGSQYIENGGEKTILNRKIISSGSHTYCLASNPKWTLERHRWYNESGKKIVPKDIRLTPISIATWYMDDGSLGSSHERLILCSDSFLREDVEFLSKKLEELYNIKSKVDIRNRIVISNNYSDLSAFRFFDLICKYVIPSMQYKLPENFRNEYEKELWDTGSPNNFYSKAIVKKADMSNNQLVKNQTQYCLEVEDNHNFIANSMVVSNCGIYYWQKGADYVKYAEDMIQKNIRVNNEFYVCPVYNQGIEDGKKFKIFEIPKMWGIGDPDSLNYYLKNHKE